MAPPPQTAAHAPVCELSKLISGSDEMSRRCRSHDWGATALGPPAEWSPQLRTSVSLLLTVRVPMLLLWGPEHVQVYNDGYRLLMGARHPAALGQRNADCWPEFWAINKPLFDRVLGGESVLLEDARYPLDRDGSGVLRDAYFTLSWSPVPDADGSPAGVCVVALETTDQVLRRALEAERERVLEAERHARFRADRARERTERLLAFTESLSAAVSELDVAQAVLREGIPAVGAAAGAVLRWASDDPSALEIVWSEGFHVPELARWQRFPLSLRAPITDAIREREPVWVGSIDAVRERYPGLVPLAEATGFGGWLAVPFIVSDESSAGRRRVLGGFGVAFPGERPTNHDEREFLLALARQSAQALARASAYETATAARAAAEGARVRAERLRDVVVALSGAPDARAVYDVLIDEAREVLGAHAGAVAALDADHDELVFMGWFGYPDSVMGDWLRVPLAAALPLTDAVRSQAPLWVPSRAAMSTRWPHFVDAAQSVPSEAWAVLPLVLDGRTLGALALSFPVPRPHDPEVLAFAQALIGHCAQALERARLYDAERAARAEAEVANRAKSEFLSVLSHELRTPLNAIGGYADLLTEGVRGPITLAQRQDLERLRRANDHMIGLVSTILDFARIDAQQVTFEVRAVPIAPMLADVHSLMATQFDAKGVSCTLGPGCAEGFAEAKGALAVTADPDKLRQILLNLLVNALKFTPPAGQVSISVEGDVPGAMVLLAVRDTGRGIAPDQLERIFDPFVQVERHSTHSSQQGVGLGLAISRELARGMGGDLNAESPDGGGSVFSLTLPRA